MTQANDLVTYRVFCAKMQKQNDNKIKNENLLLTSTFPSEVLVND